MNTCINEWKIEWINHNKQMTIQKVEKYAEEAEASLVPTIKNIKGVVMTQKKMYICLKWKWEQKTNQGQDYQGIGICNQGIWTLF